MPRTFYRIVTADPPPVEDFASPAALGEFPVDDDPQRLRLHDGISVYATLTQARNKALVYSWLGSFIARLDLPDDTPIRVERTTQSRGHHTLWGAADVIRRCLPEGGVVPVELRLLE